MQPFPFPACIKKEERARQRVCGIADAEIQRNEYLGTMDASKDPFKLGHFGVQKTQFFKINFHLIYNKPSMLNAKCLMNDDEQWLFHFKFALSVSLDSGRIARICSFCCPHARDAGPASAAPNLPMLIRTPRFYDC